ncbi:radical SAM protein [Sedimentibacter sp. zth1]|uniref:radical SAM/SPASM domain-containing protein n=1 Tax=Sedimentibacter sp. zth1 TaxID=2816908 RepID=UPI001A914BF3|nr:radical SAM protein [Sedimentibacter sp. zth1]QSX05564.1 radical SAM protein [Sedimentibacter sp. zth1]
MKLTKYMVKIDLKTKDNKYLIINTIYGAVNVVENKYSNIIDKWIEEDNIVPKSDDEIKLYEFLSKSKYLASEEEEEQQKNALLTKLRSKHIENMKNINSVTFILTYNCNFKCPYCYEGDNKNRIKVITKEMVDRVFEMHKNIEKINFFGGEPLLLSNIDIIKYIISKAPNATYYAFTNGYYLKEYMDVLINIKVEFIQVTLDGDSNIHNKTRILKNGGQTFDKIMEGIDLCLKNNISIKIRMNISNDNVDSCLKLREEMLNKYKWTDLLKFELQPIYQLEEKERIEVEDKIYWNKKDLESGNDKSLNINKNIILNTASPLIKALLLKSGKIYPKYCNCGAEENNRYYDAEGNIYTCLIAVGDTKKAVGTYYPEYKLKENSFLNRNIETIKECKDCKLAFLCGGGCGNVLKEDDNCLRPNCSQIMKELYVNIPKIYNNFYEVEKK